MNLKFLCLTSVKICHVECMNGRNHDIVTCKQNSGFAERDALCRDSEVSVFGTRRVKKDSSQSHTQKAIGRHALFLTHNSVLCNKQDTKPKK